MNDSQQLTLLQRIIESASEGLWDWDLKTDRLYLNAQAYFLLNMTKMGPGHSSPKALA